MRAIGRRFGAGEARNASDFVALWPAATPSSAPIQTHRQQHQLAGDLLALHQEPLGVLPVRPQATHPPSQGAEVVRPRPVRGALAGRAGPRPQGVIILEQTDQTDPRI